MATARISLTHPLRIGELVTPGGGLLGLTLCPGKRQQDAQSGAWARDLATDLAVIRDWQASALLCLVEPHELHELSVAELPEAVRAHGIEFHHLPIADFQVPDATFEDRWLYHGEHLRHLLRSGRRVLVHCKGGLGRSGTIAARVLVEMGEPAAAAMQRVRQARAGAIENTAQEAHVLATQAPPPEHARILGALLGGAVGDAFGYAVEFDRLDAIRARHGEQGLRAPLPSADGLLVVSDDTQMTLFALEGLVIALRAGATASPEEVLPHLRRAWLDWLLTQDNDVTLRLPPSTGSLLHEARLRVGRAPGNTCLSALRAGGDGSPEQPLNNSKGCGGVMRVAPLGFLPHRLDTGTVAALGLRAAALTHGHPSGYLASAVMAVAVRELLTGATPDAALDTALAGIRGHAGATETVDAVEHARELAARGARDHASAVAALGEGWVAEEALAIGVYAALTGGDLPEVLAIAANHDGDSDSTASVAGQLHGAWQGITSLPLDWASRLDVLAPALRTLRALYQADRATA